MYINNISSTVSGIYSVSSQEGLASTYPDLEKQELALVEDYLEAYEKKRTQPERYLNTRSKVIKRMHQLQLKLERAMGNEQTQLKILARLVNFNQIMRETHVAPIHFARCFFGEKPDCLPQPKGKELPANISDKVKAALDVNSDKLNFRDYITHHVRNAFFVKRLCEHVRILGSDRWAGTSEGATRSVILDTYNEKESKSVEAWLLASALVHEAAHIDYFYRFATIPEMHELIRVERYAYIIESIYLGELFLKASKDESVSEETKTGIYMAFEAVEQKIKGLNQNLGLAPDDFKIKIDVLD